MREETFQLKVYNGKFLHENDEREVKHILTLSNLTYSHTSLSMTVVLVNSVQSSGEHIDTQVQLSYV